MEKKERKMTKYDFLTGFLTPQVKIRPYVKANLPWGSFLVTIGCTRHNCSPLSSPYLTSGHAAGSPGGAGTGGKLESFVGFGRPPGRTSPRYETPPGTPPPPYSGGDNNEEVSSDCSDQLPPTARRARQSVSESLQSP